MPAQTNQPSLNLMPLEDIDKSPAGKFLKWALSVGRYIVIFTELIVLAAFFSRFYFDRKLSDLHEEIAQKQAIVESARDLELEARRIQSRLYQSKIILASDIPSNSILSNLAQITPTDIIYNTVYITATSVVITANANSDGSLAVFLSNLRQIKFTDISLDSVEKNKSKSTGIMFTVSAKMSPQSFAKKI